MQTCKPLCLQACLRSPPARTHAPAAWRRCCRTPGWPCWFQGCRCTTARPADHSRGGHARARSRDEQEGRATSVGRTGGSWGRRRVELGMACNLQLPGCRGGACVPQLNTRKAPTAAAALPRNAGYSSAALLYPACSPAAAPPPPGAAPAARGACGAPPGRSQSPSQSAGRSRRSPAAEGRWRGACKGGAAGKGG